MSSQGTTRIFISYSRSDEDFARRLATSLSEMGADVWIDVEDIPAGMKWSSAIQQGLDSGQLLIVLISPESMASRNVEDEWQYYLDGGKPVVPVLLRPAKIHFQLNRLQYIDFHSQPYEQAIGQLYVQLQAKGLRLNPPPAAAEQDLPDLDSMTPAELERWMTILQERQDALSQAETPPAPSPELPRREAQQTLISQRRPESQPPALQATAQKPPPNRQPLILGAVGLVAVVAVIAVMLLLTTTDRFPPDEELTATAQSVAQANQTATAQALAQANVTGGPNAPELTASALVAEVTSGAETATAQAQVDDDNDGLTYAQEAEYGTSPIDADTDGDGLPDGNEVGSCTSPLSIDSDEDGIHDDVEVQNGTECDTGPVLPGLSADNPVTHSNQWAPIEREFNGVAMELVPTGRFMMGTVPEAIDGLVNDCAQYLRSAPRSCTTLFADEVPAHEVFIDQPFWIDRHEVSNAQFQTFGGIAAAPGDWSEPAQPRTNVTWQEAEQFCELRGMSLPTEAQWEYAARGPEARIYPWGNTFTGSEANYCDASCQYEDVHDANHNDGYAVPAPVGSFPQGVSWVEALDMAGNVWEWTRTIYQQNSGQGYEDRNDSESQRVLKGGTWNWILQETRGAARSPHAPDAPRSPWYGFRCVRPFAPGDLYG